MKQADGFWRQGAVLLAFGLCLAVTPARAGGKQVPPAKPISPETLAALARDYQELGLPLPPVGAPPLLLLWRDGTTEDGRQTKSYLLGFAVAAGGGKDDPGKFLVGTEVWAAGKYPKLTETPLTLDPEKGLDGGPALDGGEIHLAAFPSDAWLSTALQCQIRGYSKLARQILERNLALPSTILVNQRFTPGDGDDPAANGFWFRSMHGGDPRQALAAIAWHHWLNAVVEVGTDRREALARLEKLFASHREFRGRARESFLADLRLTARPATGKPGSPEAVINALAEDTNEGLGRPITAKGLPNSHLNQLLEMGFAAMPALIAHVNDRRLLRGVDLPLDCPPMLAHVGWTVEQLVTEAMDTDFRSQDTGERDFQEVARRWWAKASKLGEEEYARTRALPETREGKTRQWMNTYCLWLVARKYPQYLGGIYERLLRRPDLDSDATAAFVAACEGLSREERLRLLRSGADEADQGQRNGAISALQALDPADAEARMLRELAGLPKAASPPRPATSPEEDLAWIVSHQFNSPAVWQALTEAAERADPSLRAKLLQRAGAWQGENDEKPRLKERVALLSKFFDDPTTAYDEEFTEEKARQTKDSGGSEHPELTHNVGNAAAEYLGRLLDVPDYPNVYWGPIEWKTYRATVHAALKQRPEQ